MTDRKRVASLHDPSVQGELLPAVAFKNQLIYLPEEEAFNRLNQKSYADWVVRNYDWYMWSPQAEQDAAKLVKRPDFLYPTMFRSADDPIDPKRSDAKAQGGRSQHRFKDKWVKLRREVKNDPTKARKVLLKVTSDGRPRTLNRIAFDAFGMTADIIPDSVRQVFAQLLIDGKFAFTTYPSSEDITVYLFWNDANWRKYFT